MSEIIFLNAHNSLRSTIETVFKKKNSLYFRKKKIGGGRVILSILGLLLMAMQINNIKLQIQYLVYKQPDIFSKAFCQLRAPLPVATVNVKRVGPAEKLY